MHRMHSFDFYRWDDIDLTKTDPEFEKYAQFQETTMKEMEFLEENITCRYGEGKRAEYFCCQE